MATIVLAGGDAWRTTDWYVLRFVSGRHAGDFSPNVLLGNLAGYDGKNVSALRESLARFLSREALLPSFERPKKVAFDLEFGSGESSPATAHLKAGMLSALRSSIELYAVKNPPVEHDEFGMDLFEREQTLKIDQYEAGLDKEIYQLVASGHTWLDRLSGPMALSYHDCLTYPTSDGDRSVVALPLLVSDSPPGNCLPNVSQIVLLPTLPTVPQGQSGELKAGVWSGPPLAGKTLILGALEIDRGSFDRKTPHPVLIAWAVSQGAYHPVTVLPAPLVPALCLGISLLTLLIFLGIFMPLRRRATEHRLLLPAVSAALTIVAMLGFLAGLEALLRASGIIFVQVTLSLLGVLTVAVLASVWARKELLIDMRLNDGRMIEVEDYDVFISYVHNDLTWMLERVHDPLSAVRRSDGSPLRVFYDKRRDSLFPGEAWIDKLMISIDHSRFVIAVCSKEYFGKEHPWCLDEFRRAYAKWVRSPEDPCVFPLLHGNARLPEAFTNMQSVDVDADPEAIGDIIARIVSRLDSEAEVAV